MAVPAKKNTAYSFYIGLLSQADSRIIQAAPTIAAGDVKVSIDGGTFNNLTNLPTATPPAGKSVLVSLTAAEMNGDNIVVLFSDVSGAEWCDQMVDILTSIRTVDELTYPTYQLPSTASTDGVVPTLEQAIYMINQFLAEREVVGTTVTVKNPNGTTLMTFTLNSPTTPTSITRS